MDEENKQTEAEVETEVKEEKKAEVKETPKEEKKEVEVPAKFKDIVEKIESLNVLELHELVKLFEDKFGVSAQAVVVSGGATAGASEAEVKDSFSVSLISGGEQKVQVIKAIKDKLGLGLKEAKDLVDAVPSVLKDSANKEEADALKKAIEDAGGKVEVK